MDLTALKKIETASQYEAVCSRLDELIREATEKGLLEPEADNEYTREIGRLSYRHETDHGICVKRYR